MTNPPDTHGTEPTLNLHGSGECPVCQHPFVTDTTGRLPGVQSDVAHTDEAVLEHLATHTPRELGLAWLLADARQHMARSAVHSLVPAADRYDTHLLTLAETHRPRLLGEG